MVDKVVVEVNGLKKVYGSTIAVDSISFQVRRGEIFGILGPNGAGKTTLVECLAGLRKPDEGSIQVLGLDPIHQERELRQRVGIQLQQAALPEDIRVWEALDLFASFYNHSADWKRLLAEWGLNEKTNARFSTLSGGQKQRLFIALALVNDPELVFLDELTTGLDPQARRNTWELIELLRQQGKTVILVTHYMDEAEKLCDRVALIDHGRLIALDSPQELIRQKHGDTKIRFNVPPGFDASWFKNIPEVNKVTRQNGSVVVTGQGQLLVEVVMALSNQGIVPQDLRLEQTTLEDVFLTLTGRKIREND